jgi:hypothetical protein
MTTTNTETLSAESLLNAAGVPADASLHDLQWTEDGVEIEYSES